MPKPMGMVDDPTIQTLAALLDPAKYRLIRNVPVFKSHERKTENGDIVVNDDDLKYVAEASQKLIDRDGTPARVTIGHIDPKAKEIDQPPLTGFAVNYRVGTFGPTNQKAVLCDLYVKVEDYDTVKQFPYRSVEYYPNTKEIRGVALLKRDSFLSLGALTYTHPPTGSHLRRGERSFCLSYSMPAGSVPVYFEEPEMAEENKPNDEAALSPEDEQKAESYMRHYQKKHAFVSYAMKCYDASVAASQPAAPSATNSSIPGDSKKDDDMERMANDQLMIRLSKQEAEIEVLKAANAKIVADKVNSDCERLVIQLEAQGYKLDRAKEVTYLATLPAEKRPEHVQYIAAHYQQNPAGAAPIVTYQGAVEGGAKKRTTADATKEDVEKAMTLIEQSKEPILYQAALAQAMGI